MHCGAIAFLLASWIPNLDFRFRIFTFLSVFHNPQSAFHNPQSAIRNPQ